MIGLPNYVVGSSVSAPIFFLALGLFWMFLLVVALMLAAANGRDAETMAARD